MFIISDFHDYYDVGMQNGVDMQLPYRRFKQEVRIAIEPPAMSCFWEDPHEVHSFYVIGFAGKIYPAIYAPLVKNGNPKFCYDFDSLDESFFDLYYDALLRFEWYRPGKSQERKKMKEFYKNFFTASEKRWNIIFEKFQTAIFVGNNLNGGLIALNDNLSQYRFQKVFPPMIAYQELAMYVGSRLTKPVIEEPPISDVVKAEIHGFDKFSFRKAKR